MPQGDTVQVKTPDGAIWTLPKQNLQAALSRGAVLYNAPATSPFPFTGPNAIQDAVAWVKSHPEDAAKAVEESKKTLRSQAPPVVAGMATLPLGGEGVWPVIARIAAAGGSAGLTDLGLGGTKKEAAITAAEQGGLQGAGEGFSALLSKMGRLLVAKSPKISIGGEDFPLIRGQASPKPTVVSKVTRGMGESFVGGPVEKRIAAQDTFFKTVISKAAESQGGVRAADPTNFVENTYANAKALLDKASGQYDAIRESLPNELTKEQLRRQALESATVFKGRAAGLSRKPVELTEMFKSSMMKPEVIQQIMGELDPGEMELITKAEEPIASPREKFTALQKLRSATSQAARSAYKRGLSGGSMADYGELSREVERLDGEMVSTLKSSDPELVSQFQAAKEFHAKGRELENFGMMLDSLTSGLSNAEASARGIPASELHVQSINYAQVIEKLREFDSRSHFSSASTLQRLFGKSGADSVMRSVNLINNASKSNIGIVAHYLTTLTTYGPAVGFGTELLRGRPEEAAMSAAAYPVMWSVAKLLSYPSFSEPFGKFLQASAGSKEASLWAIRAAQAGRKILTTSSVGGSQ
ncbi:MAG TPA: hypothetical protein VGT24_01510 [Candidatus Acidoferrales bacterium]|nr:hypothetical protein [Candidatus Acidoferrales bacterium]